jgi:hypothetical protein
MTPPFITFVVDQSLSILSVIGTFTAMGEESGGEDTCSPASTRRASTPVLRSSGSFRSLPAPLMIGAEYAEAGSLASSIAILAVGDLPISFIMARESYRARSLWPAVFFHSFHNTISQWLFPRFFAVDTEQPWLRGEAGVLPMATA